MDSLGDRIKFLRESRKMKQQELGDIVGLHGSNIGRIEKGKVFPASNVLLKMSLCFGVSCDWLLTGKEAKAHICDSADEINLIELYRQLSQKDKSEIYELIEFKIYKAEKEKDKIESSSSMPTDEDEIMLA